MLLLARLEKRFITDVRDVFVFVLVSTFVFVFAHESPEKIHAVACEGGVRAVRYEQLFLA